MRFLIERDETILERRLYSIEAKTLAAALALLESGDLDSQEHYYLKFIDVEFSEPLVLNSVEP